MATKNKRNDEAGSSGGKGKKKGKAKKTNMHGIDFEDDEHKLRYEMLVYRRIVATRYPDFYTFEKLGIKYNVRELLGNLGWLDFLEIHNYVVERITLELIFTFISLS